MKTYQAIIFMKPNLNLFKKYKERDYEKEQDKYATAQRFHEKVHSFTRVKLARLWNFRSHGPTSSC